MKKSFRPQLSMTGIFLAGVILVLVGLLILLKLNSTPSHKRALNKQITIGLSWGTLREERWQRDLDMLTQEAKNLGAAVVFKSANSDPNLQISQAENLINQGVDVLVVVPEDGISATQIVNKAHQAGIKVLAYDRLIRNSDLDYYVSFDNEKVGELQAAGVISNLTKGNLAYIGGAPTDNNAQLLKQGTMKILEPLLKKGGYKLVVDEFTPEWKPELAYQTMLKYLQTGHKIDGVVAANDGTAFGVIKALQEKGLAGNIPVSGQDAELAACQRVVAGTQTMTVYKPISQLAKKAAAMAVEMAQNQAVETNASLDNGKVKVPAYLIAPVAVTKANMMETIIKDGYHQYEEVYKK